MKKLLVSFISLVICVTLINIGRTEENPVTPEEPLTEPQIPGRLEGEGTHFEVTDSTYLNVTVDSTEPIKLVLESAPEMVTLHVESLSGASSTQITLSGFLPSQTYYKYEDNYHNLETFKTDSSGRYTYTQDLSSPHLIFIQPRASTIFLNNNGWSDPSVGTWDPITRTATLTQDLNQTIQIDADNIILDGNGHEIIGNNTGFGVYVLGDRYVVVKNLKIQSFSKGVYLYFSHLNIIANNIISNSTYGIDLFASNSNTIINNSTSNSVSNTYGISLFNNCRGNTITNNIASNNTRGIYIQYGANNDIINNITSNNIYGISIYHSSYDELINNTSSNNNMYGISLLYSSNSSLTGNTANNNTYGISLNHSSGKNILTGNITNNNERGITISDSTYSTLRNNLMSGNRYNFRISGSSLSHFDNNVDTSNLVDGKPIYYLVSVSDVEINPSSNAGTVYCVDCDNITIKDLSLTNNGYGVCFFNTNNSTIENNSLDNNQRGIYVSYSSNNILIGNTTSENTHGIWLDYSNSNILNCNTINRNWFGIEVRSSANNIIRYNSVNGNRGYGIELYDSQNNSIYFNNFIDNSRQQAFAYGGSGNIFNIATGGNYWSNWTSPDNDNDGFVDFPYVFYGGQDNLPLASQDGWCVVAPSTLSEKSSTETTLIETLISQNLVLSDAVVSGDLEGELNFTNLEIVSISTGSFAGIGFSKGQFVISLDGVTYNGTWQGVSYLKPEERKIYLKGSVTGEILATVEGYITESIPDSGIYDKYQATWKIGELGATITSVTLTLEGTLSYEDSLEYPSTELYVLQTNIEGESSGRYSDALNTVLTHLRVVSAGNPYYGEGLSIISYATKSGSGEGWTYDKLTEPGKVELKGIFTGHLLGVATAILDETTSPRTLSITIEGIDLGLPPAPDLKVLIWGPQRVSPGDTINYIVEYRNDGLKAAEDALIFSSLDPLVEYRSASEEESFYDQFAHAVCWNLFGVKAKTTGYLSIQSYVPWGLPFGTTLSYSASIANIEFHSDTDKGILINGIGAFGPWPLSNPDEQKKCKEYGSKRSLEWLEAFQGDFDQDIEDVVAAYEGRETETNKLGDKRLGEKDNVREIEEAHGFSGGTTVIIRVILDERLKVNKKIRLVSAFWYSPKGKDWNWEVIDELHQRCPDAKIEIWQSPKDVLTHKYKGESVEKYQVKVPQDAKKDRPWLELVETQDGHLNLFMAANNEKKEGTSSLGESAITTPHDPNEKFVSPEGDVGVGTRLDYTITYENEGEGNAYGVYITDTLDEDLDDSTLAVDDNGSYDPETRTISWFIGEVGSGEEGSMNFSVNVKQEVPEYAEVINFATVYFPSVPEATRTMGTVNPIAAAPLDTTPPITIISVSPSANAAGWNNTDVGITLTASDNTEGSGVKEIHYTLNGATTKEETIPGQTAQIIINTEGFTTFTYWAVDNAGNVEIAKSLEIKIDKTPPIITSHVSPKPNTYGWNNTDVTVSFTATDNISGIAGITEPRSVVTEGPAQHIGGEAVDIAGNRATTYAIVNIDKTPPQLNITANPDTLWPPNHKMVDVTIGGSAMDNISGISKTSFGVEDEYGEIEPVISDFNTTIQLKSWRDGSDIDGRTYTISVTTTDKADNSSSASTTVTCPHDQGKKK